eukprot:scaffold952_cov409-Prasinococcus_capsulatus_cf.AAC.8
MDSWEVRHGRGAGASRSAIIFNPLFIGLAVAVCIPGSNSGIVAEWTVVGPGRQRGRAAGASEALLISSHIHPSICVVKLRRSSRPRGRACARVAGARCAA